MMTIEKKLFYNTKMQIWKKIEKLKFDFLFENSTSLMIIMKWWLYKHDPIAMNSHVFFSELFNKWRDERFKNM